MNYELKFLAFHFCFLRQSCFLQQLLVFGQFCLRAGHGCCFLDTGEGLGPDLLQGFAGQGVDTIIFEYAEPNTLVLNTDLCMSLKGDTFNLDTVE